MPLILTNFEVYTSPNAINLASQIQAILPDLIIIDVFLGAVDGSSICAKLKSDVRTEHIPIVLITAGLFRQKDRESGADALIAKPFDIEDLTGVVVSLLD